MSGRTPGKWAQMSGAPWNILDEGGRRILWVHGNDYRGNSSEEDEANAAHIVAAVNERAQAQAFFAAYAIEARKPHCALPQRDWMNALLLRAQESGLYAPEAT